MNAVKKVLRASSKLAVATVAAIVGALLATVRFLAGAAETTPADDEITSAVRGGVMNYRTGKLDDGTDPIGWYERD